MKKIGRYTINSDDFAQIPLTKKFKLYWCAYCPIWRLSFCKWRFDFEGLNWFNVGSPALLLNRLYIRAWNLHNRVSTDGHFWGIGILQISSRHLFYIGHDSVSILFIGKTK